MSRSALVSASLKLNANRSFLVLTSRIRGRRNKRQSSSRLTEKLRVLCVSPDMGGAKLPAGARKCDRSIVAEMPPLSPIDSHHLEAKTFGGGGELRIVGQQ